MLKKIAQIRKKINQSSTPWQKSEEKTLMIIDNYLCFGSNWGRISPPPYINQPLLPIGYGVETDWKIGPITHDFFQKMRMKREEHYSVYRAILRAHGVVDRVFIFFYFWHFFSTCEKITQFLEFCKDQGGKI